MLILTVQHEQLREAALHSELAAMDEVLHRQYEQYKRSKEGIRLINSRYHELKIQIADIRAERDRAKQDAALARMESGIRRYEAENKTGNPVLDTLLTAKSMDCQQRGINMTSVADGSQLGFLSTRELCTLVGAPLDNAIESVLAEPDPEKRLLRVAIYNQSGCVMLRFENYCAQPVELGADGLLIVTPYYNKTTQRGLVAHYNAIADSVNLPIILYNVPSRTGVGFDVNTVAALAEHKNIAAIKEASGNIGYTAKVAAKCGDKIDIYSGNDDMIVPIMSLGGKGVISVLSNVLPKETHQMTQYCLENNFAAAAEMQLKYLRLINDLFMEVNPIPVKDAMNQLGMPSGPCRMPLLDMSDEHKAAMQATLRAYGMIS